MEDGSRRYRSVPDIGAILLSRLRLDGFVSIDAGELKGSLLTVPLQLKGRRLFVNVDAAEGEVTAEIFDSRGREVMGSFSVEHSQPVRGDHLEAELKWSGGGDLSALGDKRVRIRFHLRQAHLYSFWVTE